MALFLFGAGATRGASFVNPADNPCLPPLDFDFYAQLQRIANLKHKQTVRDVIKARCSPPRPGSCAGCTARRSFRKARTATPSAPR